MAEEHYRESRQLELLQIRLMEFGQQEISLARLVRDMEALCSELVVIPSQVRDQLLEQCWVLEQAYAVGLSNVAECVADELEASIDEAVSSSKLLVADALAVLWRPSTG